MSENYQRADRNIYRRGAGDFRVVLTRNGRNVYGGRFPTIEQARERRTELEREQAPAKPWGYTGKIPQRHSIQQKRAARRADGLCIICGDDAPAPGLASCRGCLDVRNFKRRELRKEKTR